jgi:Polysaccharide deacetylase
LNAAAAFRPFSSQHYNRDVGSKRPGPTLRMPKWQSSAPIDGLSVDLEDYYQTEGFASRIPCTRWPFMPSRVQQSTGRVLELLEPNRCYGLRVGVVAEREPSLIRDIVQAGHELACHSHLHRPLYQLSASGFRENLRRSRGTIEDVGGVKVVGFCAPTFSITSRSLWALEGLRRKHPVLR